MTNTNQQKRRYTGDYLEDAIQEMKVKSFATLCALPLLSDLNVAPNGWHGICERRTLESDAIEIEVYFKRRSWFLFFRLGLNIEMAFVCFRTEK
jgi:hypothetical protein